MVGRRGPAAHAPCRDPRQRGTWCPYGVDARGRGGPESVLHPASPETPYQGLLYVDTGAGGTSIRGFRIEGTTSSDAKGAGGGGIFTQQTGGDGGYTIGENILTGNTIGILLSSSGAATEVSRNVISNSGAGAESSA